MAIVDFYLAGSVANQTTTTFQPAAGTIYTFKRGTVTTPTTTELFQIRIGVSIYTAVSASGGYSSTSATPFNNFNSFSFNESGYYATSLSGGTYTVSSFAGPGPFCAISNLATAAIINPNIGVNTTKYVLVGASMS